MLEQSSGAAVSREASQNYVALRFAFFFFGLSLMQLFRKGAEVEETGRAGVCTEPAAAAGPDR